MHRNLSSTLTTWPFVASLLALLVNDAWLKAAHPGLITGKLSDIAGVALVTLLLLALCPRRPGAVYTGMAVAFAWWKSPLSQPLLDAANTLLPVTLGRTVDYTDLLALCVMPLCRKVAASPDGYAMPWPQARRLLVVPLVALTLFGLMATAVLPLTRQDYVIRRTDPAAELARASVAEVVAEVAKKHGLACKECSDTSTTATYSGDGLSLSYTFPAANAIQFTVQASTGTPFISPSGGDKADRLRADLKTTLAIRFRGLEYIEKLEPQ